MSAFALASVFGVPLGLQLGTVWAGTFRSWSWRRWVLSFSSRVSFVMPPLREHLHQAAHAHPLSQVVETFGRPRT